MRLYCFVAAVLSMGGAFFLSAQTAPSDGQTSIPILRANTHAVVVDVVVTQGKDEPVKLLRETDFHLFEDGKPQTVDYFLEHTAPATDASAVPSPSMPPNVYTNVPLAPTSESVNVLLIDLLNTDRQDQAYVHQQISDYLKGKQPGVRVAIFALSSNLRLIQGFTADSAALRSSIDDRKSGLSTEKTASSRSLQDKLDDKEDIDRLAAIKTSPLALIAIEEAQASLANHQENNRVMMTLEALQNLGRYLAAVPGRKNLLWFSSSFPVSVFPSSKEKQPLDQVREYTAAVRATADLLTVSKVAVYPIGAEGLVNEHLLESSNGGPVNIEGNDSVNRTGATPSSRPDDRFASYAGEHAARASKMAAMEELAADTGGEAIFNANDLSAATSRAIANGSHYYTIVYTPTNKEMNGQFRSIKIKMDQSKYKLSYRRGYYADDSAGDIAVPKNKPEKLTSQATQLDSGEQIDPLQPFLTRGMPSSSQILFAVRVSPAAQQPGANAKRAGQNDQLTGAVIRYGLDFLVDGKQVDLEPAADGARHAKIQLSIIAYDHAGKALNWLGGSIALKVDDKTYNSYLKSGIPAHVDIDLPNSEMYIATGVYDYQTQKAGTLEIPLSPSRN
jgi:VWFA-related protein